MRLTETQREVLELLVRSGTTEGFYLAGGTALMMRYGHRFSGDFDFFSLPGIDVDFARLDATVGEAKEILELRNDTLVFKVRSVLCSFFRYPYDLLRPAEIEDEYGVVIASDEDIAAMKAVAIIQRGAKKDFYDLWCLMRRRGWGVREVFSLCREKYGDMFNPSLLLKALVFFDDAETERVKDIEAEWESVKEYFVGLVKSLVN